jgi:hypothetical protein
LAAQLVIVRYACVDTQLHPARIRRLLAQDDPDQSRLAGTVRADDADPLARPQPGTEVVDQYPSIERLRDAVQVEHSPAEAGALGCVHRHVPCARALEGVRFPRQRVRTLKARA